jgi:membrane peptidoglycan carboxypeptidase
MLQGVVLRGTASSLRDLSPYLAGKTGTSEDENDAWFVGFTNDVTVAVWVGYDNANGRRTLGGGSTGGHVAVPIFRPIVEASWKYVARQALLAPPSAEAKRQLVMLPVDLRSGSRVAQGLPQAGQGTITEAFRTDGRGRLDDTQYRIVSELDAQLRIEGDQYGEQQYPGSTYGDRQNPDGYYYRYYGGPRGGSYGSAPPSPYQQPYQQPQYNRGLFGSWTSPPPERPPPQPQRRIDPDYFWHNRIN